MYLRLDLHLHTAASVCYLNHVMPEANIKAEPEDIVGKALAAGLDAIGIADHNTVEGIEGVREIARDKGLYVFLGVEISARGGHVVALFEQDWEVEDLRCLLHELGFVEEHYGKGFCETDFWMDHVFEKVEKRGGLAIAAHVDRKPKGFIASDLSIADKVRIYSSPHMSALEITIEGNKVLWNRGEMPNYPQRRACVLSSDAHAPAEVGRRFTYMDIPQLSLEGLRLALRECEARIKFPHELDGVGGGA